MNLKKKEKHDIVLVEGGMKQSDIIEALNDTNRLFLFKCPNCGGVHFRHAGYVETQIPFIDPKEGPKVSVESLQVKICLGQKCDKSYIYREGKFWDISEHIDQKAWAKKEEVAHEATGPGGEC